MRRLVGSWIQLAAFGSLVSACTVPPRTPVPAQPEAHGDGPAQQAQRLLPRERAEAVARQKALGVRDALAREDFAALATYVNGRVCLQAQKGGSCRWMSQAELRSCKTSKAREEWQVDTGADDSPRLTCLEAFRGTFFSNPGLASAPPTFNDFRPRPDNNGSSVVTDEVRGNIYVEFFADAAEVHGRWYPWQSLWLVFQSQGDALQLLAIQSHYWGI